MGGPPTSGNKGSDGPVNAGAQGRLGFQYGVCAVKSQK